MNDLIVSGNGKKYLIAAIFEGLSVIILIFFAAFLFSTASEQTESILGFTYSTGDADTYTFIGVIALVIMAASLFQMIRTGLMAGTKISVYGNHVSGKGMTSKIASSSFNFTYDKISHVDTSKGCVTVHTKNGAKYTCYVDTPLGIEEAIEQQLKASK